MIRRHSAILKSLTTFDEELNTVGDIPGLLWGNPADFRQFDDPFRGIREEDGRSSESSDQLTARAPVNETNGLADPNVEPIGGTFHLRTVNPEALEDLLQFQFKSIGPEELAARVFDATGLDLQKVRQHLDRNSGGRRAEFGDLVHRFGMEAFGTYLPWHAFVRSSTPWGIYILPIRIAEWADDLLQTSRHLPSPKPSWEQLFFALLWVTYRHELFHWHVETFALAHEVLVRRPIYRPYVEEVRRLICREKPHEWWEEALAQAVVLDSKLVRNRSGFTLRQLRQFLVPDFKLRFGAGYREFECKAVGGPAKAHRILSAQVARTQREHSPASTSLALVKDNYSQDDVRVPGYFCISAADFLRFQLAPLKIRHFDAYITGKGGKFSSGPGDHRILQIGDNRIHVNPGRNRDEIDLASLKATANTSEFRLSSFPKRFGSANLVRSQWVFLWPVE